MPRKLLWAVALALVAATAVTVRAQNLTSAQIALSSSVQSSADKFNVVPFEFDPNETDLVRSRWLVGTGCPNPPSIGTDPACATGDPKDKENEGLLLVKTGPTPNNAAAGARLEGIKGTVITELGYDIRKPGDFTDPRGSHCGAGAPRFDIVINGALFFIGCSSPPPVQMPGGVNWQRLRWLGVPMGSGPVAFGPGCGPSFGPCPLPQTGVDSITIIFDEGQDTGPDNFGAAFLDNIDVNGVLIGRGPGK